MIKYSKLFYIALAFLLCACVTQDLYASGYNNEMGEGADFKLSELNGGVYSLSSYKGKQPVLLFFWTTWCPYCRRELSSLDAIAPQLAKDGWELFAINLGEPEYKVADYIKKHNISVKVLLGKNEGVAEAYGILGVPTFVIIDKNGKVVFKDNYFPTEYKKFISE